MTENGIGMWRGIERWLPGYLAGRLRRAAGGARPRHLLFCIADHFEPLHRDIATDGTVRGGQAPREALAAVDAWCRDYRALFGTLRDADGRPPRHTFFYPWDEYDAPCVDCLADFCREGHGEVEVHLHHRADTAEGLRRKLILCRDALAGRHGLLGRDADGRTRYAFVHGNWCLCDSRPDGDWCGVRGELAVLAETGCYADFTFPSAPSPTQPRVINAPFYGRDPQPGERGVQRLAWVRAGIAADATASSDERVMVIPGPLGPNWRRRKWGVLPRLENAELSGVNPPGMDRLRVWVDIGVAVAGRPDLVVVKLHTHGTVPANRRMLLSAATADFHAAMAAWCRDEARCALHYVTARELYNVLWAVAAGREGSPDTQRDARIRR